MEDHFLDIEAYLDGRMSDAERNDFEIQLARDAALRTSFKEIRQLRGDLAWHYASNDIAAAAKMRREYQRKRWIWLTCLLGLLVATLAGIFIWWNAGSSSSSQQQTTPPLQVPPATNATPPANKNKSVPGSSQQTPPSTLKSIPIAGDLKKGGTSASDLYRDLPKEEVSSQYLEMFDQSTKDFIPVVPESGKWTAIVHSIRTNHPEETAGLLKKLSINKTQSDTAVYLCAVADLLLRRPSAAEPALYTLLAEEKWKTEAGYLLIWVYLLRGDGEMARSALLAVPAEYRDQSLISKSLN